MDRRTFVKSLSALTAASTANTAVPEQASKPRQLIMILGESVRYDMLNCNRQTGLHTPNLDRLAAEGIRFEQAYCCQPVCAPSRAAIWTGLYPHSNGIWGNSMPVGSTVHTIGQRLHDQGIYTALVGKWHLDGFDYFGTGSAAAGWDPDEWYDMRDYLNELSPEQRVRSRNSATGKDASWKAEDCFAHRCTNRFVELLKKQKGKDGFLAVCYDEPHDPSLCPIEYRRMYEDYTFPSNPNLADSLAYKPQEQRIWADGRLHQPVKPIVDPQFFGSHTFVDAEIGRVLDAIDQYAPDALVLYTSDHGVFLHSHRLLDKGPAMYDEIARVPFLVRWPGHAPRGATCPHLVSLIDLNGTFMEFFGFDVPKTLEGGSMLPMFSDPARPIRQEIFMEWGRYEVDHDGFGAFQPIRCIYDGRYKLSIHAMTTDELYDLKTDPDEMHNLIDSAEHAELRNALHDKLLHQMNISRDPFRGYYWGNRAWRRQFPETWQNAGMTRQRESDGYLPRELDYTTGLPMKSATRPKPEAG